ncbi:MAG TPA: fumarylacetoacetase [Gemmatimonadaceae bacterium]|nr:fumarylacetoacetase [Gemmatimonadaceae bacterium]
MGRSVTGLDETVAPERRSWVEAANAPTCVFPIQNLPFCVFQRAGASESARVGIGIGDQVLDVAESAARGLLGGGAEGPLAAAIDCCRSDKLNDLMALGRAATRALRRAASELLRAGSPAAERDRSAAAACLAPIRDVVLRLPCAIGDYTDFYASIDHATNVGSMFRPDQPLLPNYKWVPIGYHGRASSVIASGAGVRRPRGQARLGTDAAPEFTESRRLDYELELGFFVAGGNALGHPVAIGDAEEQLFGVCLLNDWSARDMQTWEYQPLGPFLAKNFATTISPWIVTLDALAPFRARAKPRPASDPAPLPYLFSEADTNAGGFDIMVEVWLSSARMRDSGVPPVRVSAGNAADLYWTPAQLLTHHTSNGCNLRPGDLLGTGTISGSAAESRGCLLERTWRGTEPFALPNGETRTFLEDGDEVTMRAYCERSRHPRIGFGECRGLVLPASSPS